MQKNQTNLIEIVVNGEPRQVGAGLIFGSMISFLGILFVGYLYALNKKAFDWRSSG